MFVFRKHFASPCAPCMLRSISGGSSLKGKSCYCMQSSMPTRLPSGAVLLYQSKLGSIERVSLKVQPLKRCSLYRGGWPWCSCYHGVKTVRCSCINLSYPESWLRSSEKGETANLRPSPQKGLRSTHRWETSVRNQVKGPGHSQKRNLGV
jgi:hypothetical protein